MNRPEGWGVCIPQENGSPEQAMREMALLQPQCVIDWQVEPYMDVSAYTYLPMVRPIRWTGTAYRSQVEARLRAHPGDVWLLGNEPERPEQDNCTPLEFADMACEFLAVAQEIDEEFQWAAPGVWVGADTYDGLAWATEFIQIMSRRRGISRPSYCHAHGYRSSSLAQFRAGWNRWRAWYNTWGRGTPVILSEVCGEAASLSVQKQIMSEVNTLLAGGEIVAALWFSSHLCNDWLSVPLTATTGSATALTALGTYWMANKAFDPDMEVS